MTSPTRPRHTPNLMTVRRVIAEALDARALVRVFVPGEGSARHRVVEGTPVALNCESDGRERLVLVVHAETETRIATNRIVRAERIDAAGNVDPAHCAGELPEVSSTGSTVGPTRGRPPTLRGSHLRGRRADGGDRADVPIDERVTCELPAQASRNERVPSVRRGGHTVTIPDLRKFTKS